MLRYRIKDYQALKQADILVKGLTLIVGESSQGKSASLRALQAACTNRFQSGCVRFGQDQAYISVAVPDSKDTLQVIRSSRGGSPQMKLGELVFSKLGRTLPAQVTEFLNLGSLPLAGENYSLTFHSQFQPPLLMGYSQAKCMELLSASKALDDLKECKEALMIQRAKNKGAIETVSALLNETRDNLSQVDEYINLRAELMESLQHNLNTISQIPFEDLDALAELDALSTKLANKACYYEKLLDDLPVLLVLIQNDSMAEALSEAIVKQDALRNRMSLLKDMSESAKTMNEAPDVEPLIQAMYSLDKVKKKIDLLKQIKYVDFTDLDMLDTYHQQLVTTQARIKDLENITINHICPICGSHVQ